MFFQTNHRGFTKTFTFCLIFFLSLSILICTSRGKQLNCSVSISSLGICREVCNEPQGGLPYSSTFCDSFSGSCVCDCRNTVGEECEETPFTPCFQDCVRKNPNPEVYLYKGKNCPVASSGSKIIDRQCACECSLRDDYIETNYVF